MNIFNKVERIKTIKEELRAALNLANVITPTLFPFKGYEGQIRKVPDEEAPNFFYTLDDKGNVERITIIFDKGVHFYNIWIEKGSNVVVFPKYRLIYQGAIDLNLAKRLTSWGGDTLEYLEANNEELIYTGSNPYNLDVKEFKFPRLKVFSFGHEFGPSASFSVDCFPNIEDFNGRVCQNDTSTHLTIKLDKLKTFSGSISPNNINIDTVELPACTKFSGDFGKARAYNLPSLTSLEGVFNNNDRLEQVKIGPLLSLNGIGFNKVNKSIFKLYVKSGSDMSLVQQIQARGIEVVIYE